MWHRDHGPDRRGLRRSSIRRARRSAVEALEVRALLSADAARFVPGEVLVEFRAGVGAAERADVRARVNGTETGRVGLDQSATPGLGELEKVALPTGLGVEAAVASLAASPAVALVQPNYIYTASAADANDGSYTTANTADQLWGMYGDRTAPNVDPYGSQAGEAWAADDLGSHAVYVGVIDTGIDYAHPDLYRNIGLNPGEIPRTLKHAPVDADRDGVISIGDLNADANSDIVTDSNGTGYIDAGDLLADPRWADGSDNDGNGEVDDLVGWDFVNNDNSTFDGNFDDHGTHVSGTIGALRNNTGVSTGLGDGGVVGVSPTVSILSGKFLGPDGSGTTYDAVKAINYFTDLKTRDGVNVVALNNSWGGGGYDQAMEVAIINAAKANILFVAAAGNDGGTPTTSPTSRRTTRAPATVGGVTGASYDSVISVAAIDRNGNLASFSNYGSTTVDLGARASGSGRPTPTSAATRPGTPSTAAPRWPRRT